MSLARGLFRTHVSRSPQGLAIHGDADLTSVALGQSKIHQAWRAVGSDHDIRRLQITMKHAPGVRVLKCDPYLRNDRGRLGETVRSRGQGFGQIQALDE